MNAEPTLSLREEHDEPDSRPVPLGPAPAVTRDDERPLPQSQRITPSAAASRQSECSVLRLSLPPRGGDERSFI